MYGSSFNIFRNANQSKKSSACRSPRISSPLRNEMSAQTQSPSTDQSKEEFSLIFTVRRSSRYDTLKTTTMIFTSFVLSSNKRSKRIATRGRTDENERKLVRDRNKTYLPPESADGVSGTTAKHPFVDTEVSPASPYEFGISFPLPKQHPDSFSTWSEARFFFSVDIPSQGDKSSTINFHFEGQHLPMDIFPHDI